MVSAGEHGQQSPDRRALHCRSAVAVLETAARRMHLRARLGEQKLSLLFSFLFAFASISASATLLSVFQRKLMTIAARVFSSLWAFPRW